MSTFAFGLESLGLVSVRRPLIAVLVLAAISAISAYGVTRLGFEDDLRSLMRSKSETFQVYDRFFTQFTDIENQIFLLAEGDDLIVRDRLEALRNLHLDLQFVDGVSSVVSIFTARQPPNENGDPEPVFPEDLPEGQALRALVDEARAHPLLGGKMLAPDGTATLVIVGLREGLSEFDELSETMAGIMDVADFATEDSGVSVVATGAPAFRLEVLNTIRSDLHMLNLFGALIAITVCAFLFRRPLWVLLASLAPLVGVLWTLGGFGLTGIKVTAMSNILPTLILVIGFSDSLHMVSSIRRYMLAGSVPADAVRRSVSEVGPACAMTTITTMIALGSLMMSQSLTVAEFGMVGALAVFGAFVAVVGLVPAMAMLVLPQQMQQSTGSSVRIMDYARSASEAAWRGINRAPYAVAGTGLAVLVVTGIGYLQLEPKYDYREYLSRESEANLAIDRINDKLGGTDSVFVLVERTGGESADAPDPVAVVRAAHHAMEEVPDLLNVISLMSAIEWLVPEEGTLPDAGEGTSPEAGQELLERLPDHYAHRFAARSGDAWLLSGYIPATPSPVTLARLDTIEKALDGVRAASPGYDLSVTGLVTVAARESGNMIMGLKTNLTLAVFVILAIIALTSGSMVLAGLAAVPNIMSLTIVAAALAVLDSGFQFTSAIALTVAFGIAVDNTVHFIHRYRLERRGQDVSQALAATMTTVGPVLIAATAVLALGLLVTQFSVLPMVELFGRLCIVILCTALFATLLVLPAMILLVSRRHQGI